MEIRYEPIGIIHTPFTETAGMPHQPVAARGVRGRVVLDPGLAEGLHGLEKCSRVVLVFHLHRSTAYSLTLIPRNGNTPRGVFSTRAPRRPNPIGISEVRLISVEGNELVVEDVDMLDGTPLLDIKPVIRRTDAD